MSGKKSFSPLREGDDFDAVKVTSSNISAVVSVPFAKGTTSMRL